MKRSGYTIAIIMALCCLWSLAAGGPSTVKMPEDAAYRPIPGMAPHPDKDIQLPYSSAVNLTNDIAWKVYMPAGGAYRITESAVKEGIQHTVPAGQWYGEVVNHKKYQDGRAFGHFSSNIYSGAEKATLRRE